MAETNQEEKGIPQDVNYKIEIKIPDKMKRWRLRSDSGKEKGKFIGNLGAVTMSYNHGESKTSGKAT